MKTKSIFLGYSKETASIKEFRESLIGRGYTIHGPDSSMSNEEFVAFARKHVGVGIFFADDLHPTARRDELILGGHSSQTVCESVVHERSSLAYLACMSSGSRVKVFDTADDLLEIFGCLEHRLNRMKYLWHNGRVPTMAV